MIYIAFSKTSHRLYVRILCHKFRHCSPMIKIKNKYVLYQFINSKNVANITLSTRDLKILSGHGWKIIQYDTKFDHTQTLTNKTNTCVQFTKNAIGIKNKLIQTPYGLYKYLIKKCPNGHFFIS